MGRFVLSLFFFLRTSDVKTVGMSGKMVVVHSVASITVKNVVWPGLFVSLEMGWARTMT